jgi:hypothetical protein
MYMELCTVRYSLFPSFLIDLVTEKTQRYLKGHGNEAVFLGFLQKLVPHRSLTLPLEPIRFWLRIRGDIRNRKTLRVGELLTRRVGESAFECLNENSVSRRVGGSPTRRVGKSLTPRLGASESHRLPDSPSRGVMVSRGIAFQIFKIFPHFKQLNQPFKGPI